MARRNTVVNGRVNGAEAPVNGGLFPPVVPVKTEKELLLEAELERLKAENTALKAKPVNGLSLRISEKGALSVYGMGRFPFTLYVEQWERLLADQQVAEIKAFIKANPKLKRKE